MSKDIREELKAYFLDYINNYISHETWALDNNLEPTHARTLLDIGSKYHDEDAGYEKSRLA